jgi:hypothetical protein
VPIADLLVAPFNLPWGSSIVVIISATNSKGASVFSEDGNGAVIITVPDSPHDIQSDTAVTSGT